MHTYPIILRIYGTYPEIIRHIVCFPEDAQLIASIYNGGSYEILNICAHVLNCKEQ